MIVNPFKSKDRTSLVALIAANLLPLGGVIFAGWDAAKILLDLVLHARSHRSRSHGAPQPPRLKETPA